LHRGGAGALRPPRSSRGDLDRDAPSATGRTRTNGGSCSGERRRGWRPVASRSGSQWHTAGLRHSRTGARGALSGRMAHDPITAPGGPNRISRDGRDLSRTVGAGTARRGSGRKGASVVRKEGLEPSRPCGHRLLRPACLPFHHFRERLQCRATGWRDGPARRSPGRVPAVRFSAPAMRSAAGRTRLPPGSKVRTRGPAHRRSGRPGCLPA
jgi:hypothetical protein